MSTPWANGLKKIGVAQVLSRAVNMPRLRATAVIAGTATGILTVPGAAVSRFAASLAWFVLGFLFFASLYAASGAIVSRQEELSSSSAPLTVLSLAVLYSGIFGVQALQSLRLVRRTPLVQPATGALHRAVADAVRGGQVPLAP